MRRAAFLDRDGVINKAIVREGKPYPPKNLAELELFPGLQEVLAQLRLLGFYLIVVTNQPDVARGKQTREAVESMHTALLNHLTLDAFYVCYHDDSDGCVCRKPLPGMLLNAAQEKDIELSASFMVGDRWRDIEAGRRAGCHTIFIDYQYAEINPCLPDVRVSSPIKALEYILTQIK